MTTPQFQQPGRADKFAPRDHPEWIGKLFLFYPESATQQTFNRPDGSQETSDIVIADVAIIDLPDPQTGQPTTLTGARIGGKGLVPQLRKMIGSMVLGRLTKLPSQGQKEGAYVLTEFTPQDAALATAYVQAHPHAAPPAAEAPTAQAPSAPPSPSVAAAPDPSAALAAFLQSKGVPVQGMTVDQMRMIAATFPDNPTQ